MDLYIIKSFTDFSRVFGAYWADTREAAIDAAKADGCALVDPYCCEASPSEVAAYHGPDFRGRKVYEFERCKRTYLKDSHRDEVLEFIYVAADNYAGAQAFIDLRYPQVKTELVNEATYCIGIISGKVAEEMFDEGWNL